MPRRSRGGPGLVTIYWRDIPAQVTATTADGTKEQVLLHQSTVFADRIDETFMNLASDLKHFLF